MDRNSFFNEATGKYGGRFELDRTPAYDFFIERYNQSLWFYSLYWKDYKKPFPNIICDFVRKKEFNAIAMKYKDTYIIGICHIVFPILHDVFSRILANPNTFPDVGNPNVEDHVEVIPNLALHFQTLWNHESPDGFTTISPKDVTRRLFAQELVVLAMDYLFDHEFSHIIFGHVDLVMERFNAHSIEESTEFEKNLDYQSMEMDADTTGLARTCIRINQQIKKNSGIITPNEIQYIYDNEYNAYTTLTFAVSIMQLLFEDEKILELGKKTHPPSRLRIVMMGATFDNMVKSWNLNVDTAELSNRCGVEMIKARKIFKNLFNPNLEVEISMNEILNTWPLTKRLMDNWTDKVRPELLKHSFRDLAP